MRYGLVVVLGALVFPGLVSARTNRPGKVVVYPSQGIGQRVKQTVRYLTNQKAYRSHADLARLIRTAPRYRAIYKRAYRQTYARVIGEASTISAAYDGADCGLVQFYARRDAKRSAIKKGIRTVIRTAEADPGKPLGRSTLDLLSSSYPSNGK